MPVIGWLSSGSATGFTSRLADFRQGLKEGGLTKGQNVAIDCIFCKRDYSTREAYGPQSTSRSMATPALSQLPAMLEAIHRTNLVNWMAVAGVFDLAKETSR